MYNPNGIETYEKEEHGDIAHKRKQIEKKIGQRLSQRANSFDTI